MHTDLELVLYNQLGQLADEADSLQHAYDKAQAEVEENSAEADQERTNIQVATAKALGDLQIRLDEAVEARDVASAAELAALQGLTAKRDEHEALQNRKMVADEELLAKASLLERVKNISVGHEQQAKAAIEKLQEGEKREEDLNKKIEDAKAQMQYYHKLSLESQGDAGSKEDLQTWLDSRNRLASTLQRKLSDLKDEVRNLKEGYALTRDAIKKASDDMAHELKKAQSRALTADIRIEFSVKEAVEKALATAPKKGPRRSEPGPEQKPAAPPGEWLVAGGATSRKDHITAARMLGAVLESIAKDDHDLMCEDEEAGKPVTLAAIAAMLATLEARQATTKGYTDRYIVKPPLTQEEWEPDLWCATDVVVLRRALSFYRPMDGAVESSCVAMLEAMFPGAKALSWWDPSAPAREKDERGREIPMDQSFKHKGCCIHCGSESGMGRARPEAGHDTKALGYAGMTAGACPHIKKINAQGDCLLCSRLCSL